MPIKEVGGALEGSRVSSLVTTSITWQPFKKGISLLNLFGGIAISLAAIWQAQVKTRKYLYIDMDLVAKRVAIKYFQKLQKPYPTLLSLEATRASFLIMAPDIFLIHDTQFRAHGLVDLVIAGWPC